MIREVLQYPDPRLSVQCEDIDEITEEIRKLAADMAETMYQRDGVGLAAPQVGERCRLIVVDVSGPERREALMTFVNPRLELVGEKIESEEGCLSVPGGYRATVTRSAEVRLTARSLDGGEVSMDADGLLAVCLQHEVDHLKGALFIDHISRLKRTLYDSRMKKMLKRTPPPMPAAAKSQAGGR